MSQDAMHGERWLPCEDQYFAEQYAAGVKLAAIAQALKRTEDALHSRRATRRLRRRRIDSVWNAEMDAQAAACATKDELRECAERLGVTRVAIRKRRNALQRRGDAVTRIRGREWPPEDVAEAQRLRDAGLTGAEIAERMPGYSKAAIVGRLWRRSLEMARK